MNQYEYNGIKTFTISSKPFYDQYNQCYKNILMVNALPQGPIKRFVRRIQLPRLSPFSSENACNPLPNCGLALGSLVGYGTCYKNNSGCDLMTPNDIPDLITFLIGNGYQIETQITNMLNQSELKQTFGKNGFTATYYGANQPNITYMR
jgi:hypothetical protein